MPAVKPGVSPSGKKIRLLLDHKFCFLGDCFTDSAIVNPYFSPPFGDNMFFFPSIQLAQIQVYYGTLKFHRFFRCFWGDPSFPLAELAKVVCIHVVHPRIFGSYLKQFFWGTPGGSS